MHPSLWCTYRTAELTAARQACTAALSHPNTALLTCAPLPRQAAPVGDGAVQVDAGEVMQLVLHWLSTGPCQEAAAALAREAKQKGLLPQRHNVTGQHGADQASTCVHAACTAAV